jgi:predicted HTH domain antitoxin
MKPPRSQDSPSAAYTYAEEIGMVITLDIPDQYLVDHQPAELARRIRLYAALLMFQSRELSAGAASEFAGVDRFTFAFECQKHEILLVDYPAEDLRSELAPCGTLP